MKCIHHLFFHLLTICMLSSALKAEERKEGEPIKMEFGTLSLVGSVNGVHYKIDDKMKPVHVFPGTVMRGNKYETMGDTIVFYEKKNGSFTKFAEKKISHEIKNYLFVFFRQYSSDKSQSLTEVIGIEDKILSNGPEMFSFLNVTKSRVEIAGAFDREVFKLDPMSYSEVKAPKLYKPTDTEVEAMKVNLAYKYKDGSWLRFYNDDWVPRSNISSFVIIYEVGEWNYRVRKIIQPYVKPSPAAEE